MRAKQEESDRQAAEVARLHATTPEQLYHADLDAFEAALDERDAEEAHEAELLVTQRGRAGRAGGGKVAPLPGCVAPDQAAPPADSFQGQSYGSSQQLGLSVLIRRGQC